MQERSMESRKKEKYTPTLRQSLNNAHEQRTGMQIIAVLRPTSLAKVIVLIATKTQKLCLSRPNPTIDHYTKQRPQVLYTAIIDTFYSVVSLRTIFRK